MRTVLVAMTLPDTACFAALTIAATRLSAIPACLSGAGASLSDVLDELAASSAADIRLIGITLSDQSPRLRPTWLGRVARFWLSQAEAPPSLYLLGTVLHGIPDQLPQEVGTVLRPRRDGLSSAAWQRIPPVRSQLLICRGPRCSARGSAALTAALSNELLTRGLLDDQVLVTQTGCLFPCNRGPVIACHPAGRWFGPIKPDDAATVADLLVGEDTGTLPEIGHLDDSG